MSNSQLMCMPDQNYTPVQGVDQSTQQNQSTPAVTQPGGNQAACANLPTAQLNLSNVAPVVVAIAVPGATATATVSLGGQLTAKEKCSQNPGTVSNTGISASGGGAQLSSGADGTNTAQLSSTLQGVTSSVSVNLNSGAPQVTVGSAGTFGSTQTSAEILPTGALKTTYQCTSRDVRFERNGIEISGNISYTLEVIVQPTPRAPWYERAWRWVSETARSMGDWLYDNRTEILVGVGVAVVVVGAAVVIVGSGGTAAPALAPALAS